MPCVYVLSNKSMPGLVKIGYTANTAVERAAQISSVTGVPCAYSVAWYAETATGNIANQLEALVHRALDAERYNRGREFFTVTVERAREVIEQIGHAAGLITITSTEQAQRAAAIRAEQARIRAEREAAENEARRLAAERAAAIRAEREAQRAAEQARIRAEQERISAEREAQRKAREAAERERLAREAEIEHAQRFPRWCSYIMVFGFCFALLCGFATQKDSAFLPGLVVLAIGASGFFLHMLAAAPVRLWCHIKGKPAPHWAAYWQD